MCRLEKLRLGTKAGKAKVAGTLMGIGGAMILTFYKGVEINLWETHVNLLKTTTSTDHSPAAHQSGDRALGSLLAVCSCLCYALWLIIQVQYNFQMLCTCVLTFLCWVLVLYIYIVNERLIYTSAGQDE